MYVSHASFLGEERWPEWASRFRRVLAVTQDSITSLSLGVLLGQEGTLTVSAAEGHHGGQTRELACDLGARECSGRGAASCSASGTLGSATGLTRCFASSGVSGHRLPCPVPGRTADGVR